MADAPFLDADDGEGRKPLSRRRVLAAALAVLTAVSTAMIHAAAQGPREALPAQKRERPRMLVPVESNVAVARVQARSYHLRMAGDRVMVYVLDDPDENEKTKGSVENRKLQQVLSQGLHIDKGPPPPGAARAAAKAAPPIGVPAMLGAEGKDRKMKAIPWRRLGEEESRPAEQVLPLRAAIIAASFPFKAQVEEYRAKLRLASDEAVLSEQGPDGAATFRFLGVRVQRRTLDASGKPLTPYLDLNLAAAYKPYLLLCGQRFEPERPPALEQVIFPGLVMPKLLTFRPHEYPQVEARLKTLRKTLEQLPKPIALPVPRAPEKAQRDQRPAPKAEAEVPPGIAKPRPEPFPAGIAKPRKAPPAKPAPPKVAPARTGVPEYCLLRVIDPTVQPGRTYQYRLQVRMAKPNYGRKDVAAPEFTKAREVRRSNQIYGRKGGAAPEFAKAREIDSDWYEVPQSVVVSPELLYYTVDQKELDGANHYKGLNSAAWLNKDRTALQIHRWLEAFAMPTDRNNLLPVGEWVVAERVIAHRGEHVGFPQRIEFPYWRTTQERFVLAEEPKATRKAPGVPVSFRADSADGRDTVLVDFEGGNQEHERVVSRDEDGKEKRRKLRDFSATELLLLTPDGKLLAHEGARDAADKERKDRLHAVRERLREIRNDKR